MVYPREVLNRLRRTELGLGDAVITYVHRGAPGDVMTVRGSGIVELERSFFVTADAKVPYHRIRRIEHRGSVLYEGRAEREEK